jgi:rRNA-processing protein FCF1
MDIIIDTNALILLVLGTVNLNNIGRHRRLSVYTEEDFWTVSSLVNDENQLLSTPNTWTEVDNLCNNMRGEDRQRYINVMKHIVSASTEKFITTRSVVEDHYFADIGITDTIILNLAKKCSLLVTGDSALADIAKAHSIEVLDLKAIANLRFS